MPKLLTLMLMLMVGALPAGADNAVHVELTEHEDSLVRSEIHGGAFVGYGLNEDVIDLPNNVDRPSFDIDMLLPIIRALLIAILVVAVGYIIWKISSMSAPEKAERTRRSWAEWWQDFLMVLRSLFKRSSADAYTTNKSSIKTDLGEDVISADEIRERDFKTELETARAEGNYAEAVRIVYLATLAELERRGDISCEIAKTSFEYLAEYNTRQHDESCRGAMRQLTILYLRSIYGRMPTELAACEAAQACSEQVMRKPSAEAMPMGIIALCIMAMCASCSDDSARVDWSADLNDSYMHDAERGINPLSTGDFDKIMDDLHEDWDVSHKSISYEMQECTSDLFIQCMAWDDSASFEHPDLGLNVSVLAKRMKMELSTCVAAERLAFYDCSLYDNEGEFIRRDTFPEYKTVIDGAIYRDHSIWEGLDSTKHFNLTTIRCGGKEWQYPTIFTTCHVNISKLSTFVNSKLTAKLAILGVDNPRFRLQVLATVGDKPIAVRVSAPRMGSLTVISVPLLFTNYGVFADSGRLVPLINGLAEAGLPYNPTPIVHVVGNYESNGFPNKPHLTYETKLTPAYKEGFREKKHEHDPETRQSDNLPSYLAILMGGALMLWVARRRTKVVPIVEPPRNKTLNLIGAIANLYEVQLAEGGNPLRALIAKRYHAYEDNVGARYHARPDEVDKLAAAVALAQGRNEDTVRADLAYIERTRAETGLITMQMVCSAIDAMERIEQ